MKTTLTFVLCLVFILTGTSQSLDELREQWDTTWPELKIPTLRLDYHDYLNLQLASKTLKEQINFFQSMAMDLENIDSNKLGPKDRFDWHFLNYETNLNLQRLKLIKATKGKFQAGGIYNSPSGEQWYAYLIKHWTSADITPEEVTAFGWEEANRIKQAMLNLKKQHEMERIYTDEHQEVEKAFEAYEQMLEQKVWAIIPHWFMPDLNIRQGTNPNLKQVPGYYGGNVLSYNLFDDPFDLSQIDWLYLHEGVPGHHFQINSERRAEISSYRSGISYSGFREGWAAYVEELAHEQQWYSGPEQQLSQMEWDLIRSIRLVLDVGLNYEGWSDEKAMDIWRSVISDSDHIGEREIARMRRWPAQVLTYKIGTRIILETRIQAIGEDHSDQALKAFHSRVLSKGSIPMALVPHLFVLEKAK